MRLESPVIWPQTPRPWPRGSECTEPAGTGRYFLVLGDGIQAVEVPAVGGFQLKRVGDLVLRLKYESPQGWITYSPGLAMDFTRTPSFRWSRPGRR